MRILLLTPGPLTTTHRTRAAMVQDWGCRDGDFIAMSERVRARLLPVCGADAGHAVIPVQGSGTHAVEAMVQSLVPRGARLLVPINGADGQRLAEIARRLGRAVVTLECAEDVAVRPGAVDAALEADPLITDVGLVHLETASGLLNPLAAIAARVARQGRRLLIDAVGALGSVPIPVGLGYAALAGSAEAGLEGVPGLAFVCAERGHLAASAGTSTSLVLDLQAQLAGFERDGQWRFTPPTHVVAALDAALDQLEAEGGIGARHARYCANRDTLIEGMRALGFTPLLPAAIQGPVIATFRIPGAWFDFAALYRFLHDRGVVIYRGTLIAAASFGIGCIGAVNADDMHRALWLIADYVQTHQPTPAAD